MTDVATEVNTWTQLSLLPPGRTTITATITIDPAHDHAHYAIELRDSDAGHLIGLHVMPSRHTTAWTCDLAAVVDRVTMAMGSLIDPF